MLTVHLKPNSRHRHEVVPGPDGVLVVYTKQPAVDGRANKAAIELLARYMGVPKSQVQLVRGAASRYKMFRIDR